LTEIALTDHADCNPADEAANRYDPDRAYETTELARRSRGSRITIHHGVELGEPHLFERQYRRVYQMPLDVVIGSIHYVGSYGVHSDLFDATEMSEGIGKYFDLVLEMVKASDIDVLGHLDYFERYTRRRDLGRYDPADFEARIRAILEAIIIRRIALEINTSGYRAGLDRPFPHPAVIQWYKEMGGTLLSLGSDAHRAEHVAGDLAQAAEILTRIGFKQYHLYRQRRSWSVSLTD